METKSKRQSRYSVAFLKTLTDWVTNHPFVRVSPITNDTLLLNGTRYPKLLREVPIREPTYWRGRRESTEDRSMNDATHEYLLAELERREVFDYIEPFSDTEPDSDGSESDEEEDLSSDDEDASEEE